MTSVPVGGRCTPGYALGCRRAAIVGRGVGGGSGVAGGDKCRSSAAPRTARLPFRGKLFRKGPNLSPSAGGDGPIRRRRPLRTALAPPREKQRAR